MSVLVYALAARGTRALRLSGVADEPLATIPIGPIDAIVGHVARPPRPTTRALQQYDRVLRAIWERRPAVLPVRFGTAVGDRAALETAVRERQAAFRRQLAVVRNRAQMTVRIVGGSGIGDRGLGIGDRGSGIGDSRASGRRYLEARARASRLEHVPGVAAIRGAATRWVRAERVEAAAGVATVYHLVPRSAAERYRQAIERAAANRSIRVRVSGPWPPYAFTESW